MKIVDSRPKTAMKPFLAENNAIMQIY